MTKIVRRGYSADDELEFGNKSIQKLFNAGCDLYYLLNHQYKLRGASVFVGNHYLLSERQRLALARAVASKEDIKIRKDKEIIDCSLQSAVNIDGFNTIITLEAALSGSVLLKCMDGTIRDLAGLRGSYRMIDKTEPAIMWIGKMLEERKVTKVNFYLDPPVSNSGRLKQKIFELLNGFDFNIQVEIINNVDGTLEKMNNVITSDSIILDKCKSWVNLNKAIIEKNICNCKCIDFSTYITH